MLSTRNLSLPRAFSLLALFCGCSSAEEVPTVRLVTTELRPAANGRDKPQIAGTCTFSHPDKQGLKVHVGTISPPPTSQAREVSPSYADRDEKLAVPNTTVEFSIPVDKGAEYLLYCSVVTADGFTSDDSRRIVVP